MRFHCACLFLIYVGMLLVACDAACAGDSANAPPKSVQFDNQTLNLAWQGGTDADPIYEYVPAGETLDHWTHLASIREYADLNDASSLAADTLKLARDTYTHTPGGSIENPTTGDTIINFCAWPDDESFLEFNVFKYSKRPGGGTIAFQYAVRVYGDATEFAKNLPALSERLVNEMAEHGLQTE